MAYASTNSTDKFENKPNEFNADKLSSQVENVKDQANNVVNQVKDYAETGKEFASEKIKEVSSTVKDQSDQILAYIKKEPTKSVIAAFAAGYVIHALCKK